MANWFKRSQTVYISMKCLEFEIKGFRMKEKNVPTSELRNDPSATELRSALRIKNVEIAVARSSQYLSETRIPDE